MTALSIRKRLADTTVELPSGGSMMIAGLVRDDVRQAVNGLPGLSKLPVLGTLFRSRDFVRNETNSSSSSRPISPGRRRATSSPSRTTISTPRATAPPCSSAASTASTAQ